MRLSEYIELVDRSRSAFAERAGVKLSTLNRVADGEVRCRIDIAQAIVRATHDRPTASGGVVTFEELVPRESSA